MSTPREKAERFLALHRPGTPLLMPNVWDQGTAKVVASLGFEALATTSSGHAATLGRLDGAVTLDEVLAHTTAIAGATDLPVSADFENGFADAPDGVAANVTLAAATGLAGCSIEDFAKRADDPIYDVGLAAERIAAAAQAAHRARRAWCSRLGPRTTCTGGPISPTRSPGCSGIRRPVPTCSTHPGSPIPTTSAAS